MHEITLFDETLDINLTQSYHISIQADLDGFSFCILNIEEHKYLGLRHIQRKQPDLELNLAEQIKKFIKDDELLKQIYKSAGFLYSSSKSTLVPYPLFSKDNLNSYFSFNHSLNPDDIILLPTFILITIKVLKYLLILKKAFLILQWFNQITLNYIIHSITKMTGILFFLLCIYMINLN